MKKLAVMLEITKAGVFLMVGAADAQRELFVCCLCVSCVGAGFVFGI